MVDAAGLYAHYERRMLQMLQPSTTPIVWADAFASMPKILPARLHVIRSHPVTWYHSSPATPSATAPVKYRYVGGGGRRITST